MNAAPGPSSSPSLSALADPPPRMMDSAAMDYFLIELVQTLSQSAKVADARAKKVEQEMIDAGLLPPPPPPPQVLKGRKELQRESTVPTLDKTPAEEEEESVRARLEAIGLHVGANITERLCHDRLGFSDTLDTIKFICKELWSTCWDKQVDNLRTNHRGVYVLQDNSFKPIARISSWESRADATRRAKLVESPLTLVDSDSDSAVQYVAMSAGTLRGSLARLGLQATIIPEINLPQCTFQVKLPKGA
ncbi:TRAPP complex subunit trs33 [Artomyces pyxidatus]|uniref:TRAPP complex subunit trs33 n=1 Tax=Artomyces pyxidatus TaxID=48021 RepID=A0ACB8T3C6_9AGAM|nr:TRAPP complex subunit trs33 [Artomyces pyxidatus]